MPRRIIEENEEIDSAIDSTLDNVPAIDDDHEELQPTRDEDLSAVSKSARQLDAEYSTQYHIPKKLKRRYELIDSDVLLSVRNLKQFFFFGSKINNQKLKAVSNVSFDVHKGECFGIVGESGCGKTTTGRTIIKLYDATSGSVYYRGYRIGAGPRWNKKEIKWVRIKGKKKIADIQEKTQQELAALPPLDEATAAKVESLKQEHEKKLAELKAAFDAELAATPELSAEALAEAKQKHADLLAQIGTESEKRSGEIRESLEKAKAERDAALQAFDADCAAQMASITGEDDASKLKKRELKESFEVKKATARTAFHGKQENAHYLLLNEKWSRADLIEAENARYEDELKQLDQKAAKKAEYEAKVAQAEADTKKAIGELDPASRIRHEADEEIAAIKEHIRSTVAEQRRKIRQIKYDNAHTPKRLLNEIQMIFQDPVDSLDPRMTVEDIIQEGLRIQGHHNRAENHQKVVEMLEKVGLVAEHASRYPHEFSGGQRQRIGIARALVMNPKLLICDEPISALDVSIRAQIINLLNDLKDEMGLTIIFIAHDLSVVKYFCNRIAVMYFGKMVELATSEELFRHPLHPYTVSLLSAIPKPNPLTEKERVRILYNPQEAHDYSVDKPELREVCPGHVVYCNEAEFHAYQKQIQEMDAASGENK